MRKVQLKNAKASLSSLVDDAARGKCTINHTMRQAHSRRDWI